MAHRGLTSLEAEGRVPKAGSLHESRARVANDSRESQERVARESPLTQPKGAASLVFDFLFNVDLALE